MASTIMKSHDHVISTIVLHCPGNGGATIVLHCSDHAVATIVLHCPITSWHVQ